HSILTSFSIPRPPPGSPLFPYTTLFRSGEVLGALRVLVHVGARHLVALGHVLGRLAHRDVGVVASVVALQLRVLRVRQGRLAHGDRKSTRLNSSHLGISYAVFCLKKKIH